MKDYNVTVQQLIDHIKTSQDIDPWAAEMAEDMLKKHIPMEKEIEGGSNTWWMVCPECRGNVGTRDKVCKHCWQYLK